MKRTRTGPPSSTTPRSTTNRAACVTLFASMPRTAKYPLSEASAEPGRPPNANTCTHESAASGSDRSSPSLRNFRNRPQHDDGRERQLDGERRQTEGAASGSGGGSQGLVKALRSRARRLLHAPQRDLERHLECLGGGGGDGLRGGSGERVSDKLNRLADHIREPRGKPGMFERGSGAAQRRQVAFGHACSIEHRLHSSSAREPGVLSQILRTRPTAMLRSSSISGKLAARIFEEDQ